MAVLNALILPNGAGEILRGYQLIKIPHTQKMALTSITSNEHQLADRSQKSFQEASIRIVEVRSHPLGLRGLKLITVLEIVSKNVEIVPLRCLCLDAERISDAIKKPYGEKDYIEVIDATVSSTTIE